MFYLSEMLFILFKSFTKKLTKRFFNLFDNSFGISRSYFVNSTFVIFIHDNFSAVIDRHINLVNSIYFNTANYLIRRTVDKFKEQLKYNRSLDNLLGFICSFLKLRINKVN